MTHRVFGAGLVGGYLAGALMACGEPVSLVARPRARARLRAGLRLTDLNGNSASLPAPVFADPGNRPPDYLWLTVKCTDVEAAVPDMGPHIGRDTVIICCQNGLDSDVVVRRSFPDNLVLRAMVPFNVTALDGHHLHRGSAGVLRLEQHPRVESLAGLDRPLMPLRLAPDMDAMLWAKLQLNLFNAINALADLPVRSALLRREYRRVYAACMRELLEITSVMNLDLPRLTRVPAQWLPEVLELPNWLFHALARAMLAVDPHVRTSMWWDLRRGKPTEIDFLNGAVVARGRALGIPTPVNERVLSLVREAEVRRHRPATVEYQDLLHELYAA